MSILLKAIRRKPLNYILQTMFVVILIVVFRFVLVWEAVPYEFERLLFIKGSIREILLLASPVFIVGFLINLRKMLLTENPKELQNNPSSIPVSGFFVSVMAGVMEELAFRWVMLYGIMGIIWLINRGLTAFFDIRYIEQVFTETIPNFSYVVSLGSEDLLAYPGSWTLGLAMLLSNWKFQKGHVYQGKEGKAFSYFAGLFFFWITFRYGLPVAMIVHFAFDMMVFIMLWADVLIEKVKGSSQPYKKVFKWYP